ncbi:sensor histidine kinase [Paenibacillus rhizophilus]|uniref:histidine kinase n=1 Tax=Paenibacillus rhizophilus TaxID=1850366 RepID=A0A3N9Q116_9BACL|nr:HAMP domain-containing sensor histidine kinase [Paenibacillus rhizophilus]RQW11186.1 sensor histidine kinase [Paenibacillus rhizophilus]
MKNNRIGLKLGLVISGLFLVVLLFLGVAVDRMFTSFYYANMRTETEELASHFSVMAESSENDTGGMMGTFAEFSGVGIYNVHRNGNVMMHSGVQEPGCLSFIRTSDVNAIFLGKKVSYLYEDPAGGRYFVSGEPVVKEGKVVSALYIMASTERMDRSLAGVRKLLILSGIGAFLLALGSTWIIAQFLSRPLLQMQKATRKIAAGELETRVDIGSKDEMGALAGAINDLAVDLQRYRDSRQEFFANISHELRTPITYLEGYANVVKERLYETEEEKDRYLDIIFMEARRIQHLVDDLFELAKMEEGKISLEPEWVDLAELTEQAVEKTKLKAGDKNLELNYTVQGTPERMYTDGARMEQIMLNLLENAIRYTERGTVNVRLSFQPGVVKLAVEDTGIGIPADELPFIFERFYRVEKSRSRSHGGTGLGLSIVYKLTGLLGGKITVASRPGEGTCFELYFELEREPREGRL